MSALAGIIAVAVAAQAGGDSRPTPLTLDQAIRAAEQYSTAVKNAQSEYDAAKARLGQDQSRRRPQLSFRASATRFDDRTTISFPGSKSEFELAPNNQEELSLVLSQDLDISKQLGMIASQAKLRSLAAAYRLRSTVEDQDLNTTTVYYAVLRAEQNVRVANASLSAYREQASVAERLYKGGVGQKIDTLRAESQVAEAERELVRRQNELDSARSALNDQLNRPLDAPLALVDPGQSDQKENALGPDERAALIAQALDKRPEALAASIDLQAAEKGVSIAKTGNAPSVIFSLSGNRYPTTSFVSPRQNVVALTLGLSFPISDGGLTREQVHEARAGVDAAKARQEQTRRSISLEVQNAALDVETERKRLDAANVALTAATAARKLAQQRFESQVGLYSEVTDAQSELTAAQAAQVQATYDLLTAKARLSRAVSRPLIP
ncbi:TolC family protein [Fimbriimonas ginsengisoli]|uniref:Outer membrane efflux protein n=1 Tax=Fimbriimonas ginsengisoli Gsoil 348 TaxID=661478 RepID=A0A068NNS4_FIMGI|nr:TolC family protein [Fimbriimonas ginsengisoli]AIE84410.1 outer membrane efflux protein [Fimbriimonas ginsengisoli Gsoil 348]